MATGASTCDLAIILVDATKGLTRQTERHSRIVSLFGVKQVMLAVNKMDLVEGDQTVFRKIEDTCLDGFRAGTRVQRGRGDPDQRAGGVTT